MAAKLSNDELAERVRNRVKRNCAKYRERLNKSGRTQTLVWLPDTIRAQLDSLVEQRNESLSAVTTDLLSAALTSPAITPTTPPITPPEPITTTTPNPITTTPTPAPTIDYSREARLARRRRVVETCADSLNLTSNQLEQLAWDAGIRSETGGRLRSPTIRQWCVNPAHTTDLTAQTKVRK